MMESALSTTVDRNPAMASIEGAASLTGEPIRLVIWDLDETFWHGTVTEGGIRYNQDNHDIVVELARRGIISSICSKNEHDTVIDILKSNNIHDYFVFPSINWEPKGIRIRALIEQIQLRPATVLFIDDNPMNLREVKFHNPDIQVLDHTSIPDLLGHPLLKGKNDLDLTRLKQYRLLEKRKADEAVAGGDPADFLRTSGIRVYIEHDVEAHLDRAIELINRTNQLNFTKIRLSEDIVEARQQLTALLRKFLMQCGLVHVVDQYGDYGFVGFYMMQAGVFGNELLHYCFSCRTLGMHVETALYRKLGRPGIKIVGEVLTDIRDESFIVDWISYSNTPAAVQADGDAGKLSRIFMRGGCDMLALQHYVALQSTDVIWEGNQPRAGLQVRIDHSMMFNYAVNGLSADELAALWHLGYRAEDFVTAATTPAPGDEAWILSFWTDAIYPVYRHRRLGLRAPLNPPSPMPYTLMHDLSTVAVAEIPEWLRKQGHWVVGAFEALKEDYEYEGLIAEDVFKSNLEAVLARRSPTTTVFIIGALERHVYADGRVIPLPEQVELNRRCRDVIADKPDIRFLEIQDFIQAPSEILSANHYDRQVYFRVHRRIADELAKR
jgi:FkbH-like protein